MDMSIYGLPEGSPAKGDVKGNIIFLNKIYKNIIIFLFLKVSP